MQAPIEHAHGFLSLVARRRSCRRYDASRPVARELLVHCVEAARLAPSACNRQPWRFVIVDDVARRNALFELARLPGITHAWWRDVPVFVALCAKLDLVAPALSGVPYHMLDLGIAGEHFVLAATELGLATCWLGWFSERAVKRVLGVPRRVRVVALLAVGYAADVEAAPERAPRAELSDILHWNRWT
jgi:nitroreductase